MLRVLLHQEWRLFRTDKSHQVTFVLLCALSAYAAANGLSFVRKWRLSVTPLVEKQTNLDTTLRADSVQYEKRRRPSDTHRQWTQGAYMNQIGARYGNHAVFRLTPLAALGAGVVEAKPLTSRITTGTQDFELFEDVENRNPVGLLQGRLDLTFVAVYLAPLFMVLLMHGILSSERESGALALVLSQPVTLRLILWSKVLFRSALVLTPLSASATLVVLATSGEIAGSHTWVRLGIWLAVVAAYLSAWAVVVLAVTAAGKTSETNAMVLGAIWLIVTLGMPSLLDFTVRIIRPPPSRMAYIQAVREARNRAEAESQDANQVIRRYYSEHPDDLARTGVTLDRIAELAPVYVANQISNYLIPARTAEFARPAVDKFESELGSYHRLAAVFRRISPPSFVEESLTNVAGTGDRSYEAFQESVRTFRRDWHAFFWPLFFGWERMRPEHYDRYPRYLMPEEPLALHVRTGAAAIGVLALNSLFLLAWSRRRFRNYDVH
jgi:ABC-2 type transport system permease protein